MRFLAKRKAMVERIIKLRNIHESLSLVVVRNFSRYLDSKFDIKDGAVNI